MNSGDSACLPAPPPFPSPQDCPLRENAFALSVLSGIAVTDD